jgi:hypothetical protein
MHNRNNAWPITGIAIPDLLQVRAKKLGLAVTADAGNDEGLDYASFLLRCKQTGHLIWAHGLSAEGVANALRCFEREIRQPRDVENVKIAWQDFTPDFKTAGRQNA